MPMQEFLRKFDGMQTERCRSRRDAATMSRKTEENDRKAIERERQRSVEENQKKKNNRKTNGVQKIDRCQSTPSQMVDNNDQKTNGVNCQINQYNATNNDVTADITS